MDLGKRGEARLPAHLQDQIAVFSRLICTGAGRNSATRGTNQGISTGGLPQASRPPAHFCPSAHTPSPHPLLTPSPHPLHTLCSHALLPSRRSLPPSSAHTRSPHTLLTPYPHALLTRSPHPLLPPSPHSLLTPSAHALYPHSPFPDSRNDC